MSQFAADLVDNGPIGPGQPDLSDIAAEEHLVGLALGVPRLLDQLRWLRPEAFSDPACTLLWRTMATIRSGGTVPTVQAVAAAVRNRVSINEISRIALAPPVTAGATTIDTAQALARRVADLAQRRRLAEIYAGGIDALSDPRPDLTADEILAGARASLDALGGESGPPRLGLRDLSAGRWAGTEPEPVAFVLQDVAQLGAVTLLVGHGGSGKTMLAQQACTAVASGRDFLGRGTIQGTAVGIFAEDPENVLHGRQNRINSSVGVDYDDLGNRLVVASLHGQDATLWRNGEPTPLAYALEQELGQIADLKLVTLDNAALVFDGDENVRVDVSRFVSWLDGLAGRLGCSIILTTHASKSQDRSALKVASGSTAWVNRARVAVELRRSDDGSAKLVVVKSNNGPTGTEIDLEWSDRHVMVAAGGGPIGGANMVDRIDSRNAEELVLEGMAEIARQGGSVTLARTTDRNVRRSLPQRAACCARLSPKQIEKAVFSLLRQGLVREGVVEDRWRNRQKALLIVPADDHANDDPE